MVIQVDTKDGITEVTPFGDLAASTVEELRTQITALIDQKVNRILLNLGGVHFIDSMGLNLCIVTHKKFLNQKGRIVFSSPSEVVGKVFKMTGASQKIIMADNREEGLKLLSATGDVQA